MSKLGCTCGHVIVDQTDYLSYKGRILKDQDDETFFSRVSHGLAAFAHAVANDERETWIKEHFKPGYPTDLDDRSVIYDFISMIEVDLAVPLYECEECGRLWVQSSGSDGEFFPYSPDNQKPNRILKSEQFVGES